MYQQSSQSSTGSQPRPPTCYNCGASDHFMMACPEPTRQVPAGLAAARAAKATSPSSETVDNSQAGSSNRPFKRQKTGPVVTRYPAPTTGPVITQYAPPLNHVQPHTAAVGQGYYGAPPVPSYQQQPPFAPLQAQPYVQHVPPQQGIPYTPYGPQPTPNEVPGYRYPSMPGAPQGYGQAVPNVPQSYDQPPAQIQSQQYVYQTPHNAPYQHHAYPTAPATQQYGYDTSMQYGPQQMTGQQPQNYPPYHGPSPAHGQLPQQYSPYEGPPPVQTSYSQSPAAQQQQPVQQWGQPPVVPPAYSAPAYQPAQPQYQQPCHNQYRNPQNQRRPYQPPQLGLQTSLQPAPTPSSRVPLVHQQGHGSLTNLHQRAPSSGPLQSSDVSSTHRVWRAPPIQPPILEKTVEEQDFEWNLEKIFAEKSQPPADPIAHPLPTIFDEEPILPPAYNATAITCKYVRPGNLEVFMRDIRLSLHWPSLKSDPVFNDIAYDSPLIPLEEIGTWLPKRHNRNELAEAMQQDGGKSCTSSHKRAWSEEQDGMDKQINHEAFFDSAVTKNRSARPDASTLEAHGILRSGKVRTPPLDRSSTPAFGRSGTPSFGADDDAWAPQPGEGQIATSPDEDPTEALLASLGVTGAPKPVLQKPPPFRQDSGYGSARGSYSNGSTSATEYCAAYGDYRQPYNGSNPPPPPPLHMRRQVDGALDSPSSDGSGRAQPGIGTVLHDHQNNGVPQASSPLTPTSAEGAAPDSTVLNERRNGRKAGPMRQVDDVTPKLKRRQPQVADAYSRRW